MDSITAKARPPFAVGRIYRGRCSGLASCGLARGLGHRSWAPTPAARAGPRAPRRAAAAAGALAAGLLAPSRRRAARRPATAGAAAGPRGRGGAPAPAAGPPAAPDAPGPALPVLRLLLPALGVGALAGLSFCPCALALRGLLAEPAREILRDDMTQFTQNAFTVASLLFSLLLTDTLGLMLQRQERLHLAIYSEASEARALVEQLSLLGAARGGGAAADALLADVEAHLDRDLRQLSRPLLPPERRAGADPLERLLFATSVGMPSEVCCATGRALRQARAQRLAAVQRRFPAGHFAILAALALLVLGFFVLLGAGVAGFEPAEAALPGHILALLAPLFGLLATAISLAALVLRELGDPGQGLFGVRLVLQEALSGLLVDLRRRREGLAGLSRGLGPVVGRGSARGAGAG